MVLGLSASHARYLDELVVIADEARPTRAIALESVITGGLRAHSFTAAMALACSRKRQRHEETTNAQELGEVSGDKIGPLLRSACLPL